MEKIRKHKIKIIVIVLVVVSVILVPSSSFAIWTWNNLNQIPYPDDTTTFIGSSDVVQLGCYSENAVKSVTINKTTSTVVYSTNQLNSTLVNIKLNKTEPRHLTQGPSQFPVYYYSDEVAIYTVQNGQISLNFSVQRDEITDSCILEIFIFDSFFEFAKFLYTGESRSARYTDRKCLKSKEEFLVNFTLPSLKFTYIAGLAIAGVNEVSYSTVGGFISTYNTSNYKLECRTNNDDNTTCRVEIGGGRKSWKMFSGDKLCLLVGEVLNGSIDAEDYYTFIETEIQKAYAPPIIFTTCASVCFIICIILVVIPLATYCKNKYKSTCIPTRPTQEEQQPLLTNNGGEYNSTNGTVSDLYTPAEQVSHNE